MLKEVRFSYVHDDCWLLETTQRYPSLTLVISSVYQVDEEIHVDLFVHGNRNLVEAAWNDWKTDARIRKISKLYEGPKGLRFHVSYSAEHSVYPHIIHHTPISLGIISMSAGTEFYNILGESEDVQQILEVLGNEGTSKVLSVKNLQEVPEPTTPELASSILGSLTDKQIEAILLAHSEGYYNWPRELSASDLAARLGLSSAAFLDHLRRAEAKAVEAVVESLKTLDPARVQAVKAHLAESRRRVPPNPAKAP